MATYHISQELTDNTVVTLADLAYTNLQKAKRVARAIAKNPPADVVRVFVDDVFGSAMFTIKCGG
jgi:hypothetical protein